MATFVSVPWTTGDIITEVKLDNMVSNSQSEDAHAANGMIMNNNVAYRLKEAGGTLRDGIKLNTSDEIEIGGAKQLLDYAEVTADQTGITTEVALTGLTVTVTTPTLLGRRVKITGKVLFQSTVAADQSGLIIHEDGAAIDQSNIPNPTANLNSFCFVTAFQSPSASSHTYLLRGRRSSGSGNITMVATSTVPAFISVEVV